MEMQTMHPQTPQTASVISDKDAVLSNIYARTSVRQFSPQQVSKDDLTTLVKAGMAAPSGMNLQPWQFIVVTGRAELDKLAEKLQYAQMLKQANAAIVVCGDQNITGGDNPKYCFWMEDCSAATENILLAAQALGLGGVWTAAHPYKERMDWVTTCLGLPKNILPLCVIPIGYPSGDIQPKDKFDESKLHWGKW